jgi:hypothetical protein
LRTPGAADRLLELVGVDVAPGADDEVLDPAGDVELAVRDVAEVAGVEPVVVEQRGGGLGVAEVAARRRRALELHPALLRSGSSRPAASTMRIS